MGTTRKVLRQVAWEIESSPGVYQEPNTRVPHTSFTLNAQYDMIADEGIEGSGLMALPNQGTKRVEGTISGHVDALTIAPLLEAAFGAESGGSHTFPLGGNTKSLSICAKDEVKTYKYAGCYIKSISFSSEAGGRLNYSADIIGYTETRDDTSFPTMSVEKGVLFLHQHAGSSSGFFRAGDQDNALTSGDEIGITNIEIGWEWGFDHQFDNTSQTTLVPLSSMLQPTMSFQVSRHNTDAFHTFRDSFTALQAEIRYYQSATYQLEFEFPNLRLAEVSVSEDDIGKIDCVVAVGRNGAGTNYDNTNYSYVSPIRAILTNS